MRIYGSSASAYPVASHVSQHGGRSSGWEPPAGLQPGFTTPAGPINGELFACGRLEYCTYKQSFIHFLWRYLMDKHTQSDAENSNMIKDPKDWTTGDEPMTGAQKSYLKTLSEEAGEEMDENLTKAQAAERIDALQKKTGRGTHQNH